MSIFCGDSHSIAIEKAGLGEVSEVSEVSEVVSEARSLPSSSTTLALDTTSSPSAFDKTNTSQSCLLGKTPPSLSLSRKVRLAFCCSGIGLGKGGGRCVRIVVSIAVIVIEFVSVSVSVSIGEAFGSAEKKGSAGREVTVRERAFCCLM